MSNPNSEIVLDESDSSRPTQHSISNPTTKKKSGFQITSVTDSGHGRPASIVRDGEESADDLDESHASYSDVSYSRATDVDHDQESTASEDTLNISAHESATATHAEGGSSVNHISAVNPHQSQQSLMTPQTVQDATSAANKIIVQKDGGQDMKKVQNTIPIVPTSILKDSLNKQHSEHLESPQELPHDNVISDNAKYKKTEEPDSRRRAITSDNQHNHEQNSNSLTTTVSSITSSTTTSLPSHSVDNTDTSLPDRPNLLTTALVTSATTTTKPVAVSAAIPNVKVPGTRVYKVVKRETAHPTKRIRGRWNWYDFTDTQAPTAGISHSVSTSRLPNDGASLHTYTYTNTLMSPSVVPFTLQQSDSASSIFKDQLLSAAGLKTNHRDAQMMSLGTDVLRNAMKYVGSKTSGDPSTGDMSAAARTLKIDNKIEAAMDLVKKHLMSAVRDEVDELKEKIKDLTHETTRLKTENKELRAVLPPDVVSQVQANLPKDFSKENHQAGETSTNTNANIVDGSAIQHSTSITSFERSLQKGMNAFVPQDLGSSSQMLAARLHSGKPKMMNVNMTQPSTVQGQRQIPTIQDVSKVPVTKSIPANVQATVLTQPHLSTVGVGLPVSKAIQQPSAIAMQQHIPAVSHQVLDQHKSEPGVSSSTESGIKQTSAKAHDANFDKKNPS